MRASDPTGLHRVLDEAVVLPQAAQRLDTRKAVSYTHLTLPTKA